MRYPFRTDTLEPSAFGSLGYAWRNGNNELILDWCLRHVVVQQAAKIQELEDRNASQARLIGRLAPWKHMDGIPLFTLTTPNLPFPGTLVY